MSAFGLQAFKLVQKAGLLMTSASVSTMCCSWPASFPTKWLLRRWRAGSCVCHLYLSHISHLPALVSSALSFVSVHPAYSLPGQRKRGPIHTHVALPASSEQNIHIHSSPYVSLSYLFSLWKQVITNCKPKCRPKHGGSCHSSKKTILFQLYFKLKRDTLLCTIP